MHNISGCSLRAQAWSILCAAILASGSAAAQTTFSDVSDTAGVGRQTETYGASWGDINGDHYPDLFLNNHRLRPSMYLNLGDGTFYDTAGEVATWVNRSTADQHGASFADFDNDGDQDLLVSLGTGNPNQFFVNHYGALLDRTAELGIGFDSIGGRLPVWLDYNGDGLLDVVLTQFGGAAKVFRQTAGAFVEATSETQMLCLRFHFGMLLDVQGDGRLDFVCPDDASFPQRIYDTSTLPWMNITSALPKVPIVADAIIADFDNNQRMDMFLINNVQLRPSGATRVDDHTIEASLSGGEKGFNFISDGPITIDLDWNKLEDGFGLPKIRIGDSAVNPSQIPFTLDPADPNVLGMAPSDPAAAPLMRLGFDAAQRRWTIIAQTENLFSEAYYVVTTTAPITDMRATGLWGSDKGGVPTLLMEQGGTYMDVTTAAGLDAVIECVSAAAGDFDNDMDVDLYLACRKPTANIENMYFDNVGNGVFTRVPGAGGATGPIGSNVTSGAGKADSVVIADYDVDGFLDLAITNGVGLRPKNIGGPNTLYRNDDNGNHWIQLDLIGTTGTREPVGARVSATANGVTQLRVYNGGYHRWSQESRRMHFGLAGALRVDLAVHWPNGSVETFEDVAADRLYEITEGQGLQAVTPGGGNPYSCGRPVFQASQDAGAFVWRDCRNDLWKVRFASGGPGTVYTGRVLSQLPFVDVSPFSIEATDVFDTESDPRQAVFEFEVAGTGQDGFDVILAAEASGCLIVDSPTAAPVIYGPFNALVTQPVDLLTGGSCALSLNALSVTGAAANESAGSIDFVVSLSAASVTPVEVSVATADGTATAGSDYSALALQVLTFQPGETEKVVTVGILDDAIAEGDETFFLTLTNPSGATITAASATATINDDEVGLSIADVAGAESAGTLTFTVSLSTARTVPVTVEFSTADVEATAGQDYVAVAPTVLTLDPGELMASVSVILVDDHLIEGNETFLALLANASGAEIVDGSAIGTIADDESPAVLTVADIAAVESDGVLTFTAMLSAPLAAAASVDFATQDGSAVAGTDYLAASGTLVFAPGNVSRSVQLTLLDDQLPEPGEAFFLRLTNPANLVLARTQATATVADDDGALICGEPDWDPAGEALVAIWQNCIEGTWHLRATAGSGFRSYAGTVFSNQGFESVTGVSIEGGDTLDVSSDPTAIVFGLGMTAPGFDGIDFAASADASLCVDVNVQPGSSVIAGAGRVPVTLSRFDPRTLQSCPALPTLTVSDVDVSEADGTAVFTLQMSAASTEPVTVDVRTLNGSAIAGSDYVALPAQTVVFAPGEVSRQLPVTVLADALVESDETFTLALERAVNARFGVAQVVQSATATIRDHQVIGRFSVADQTFSEAAGVVNVVIALTAPATADVTVQVETSDLTASAGSDYAGISSGTLTFAPGEVTALLPLTLLDDKLIEGPETLRLTLSNPVGAPLGRSEATLTIEDDDRRSPVPEPRNGGGGGTAAWLNMLLVLALVVRSRKWRLTVANAF